MFPYSILPSHMLARVAQWIRRRSPNRRLGVRVPPWVKLLHYYVKGYFNIVFIPVSERPRYTSCLTTFSSVIRRELVLSTWYGPIHYTLNFIILILLEL